MIDYCNKDPESFVFMSRKEVMRYEYVDSWEKFHKNVLPSKNKFFGELNNEGISDKGYRHVQKVWNKFRIKDLGEY